MSTRPFWYAAEAVHAVVYFAPDATSAYAEVGLRGFWRGYFASRAGALGPVGPAVVTALFHGFAPDFVARAVPAVWDLCAPGDALRVREDVAARALAAAGVSGEAAALTGQLVASLTFEGRALAAAHAALPRPVDPLRALWWDCTVLREHRGDGHVAALVAAGLDGCEANVLGQALGRVPARMQEVRGWSDDEWAAAGDRLRRRGLVDAGGRATARGRAFREEVERATDATVARVEVPDRLTALLTAAARSVAASGAVPYPNPVGVPPTA